MLAKGIIRTMEEAILVPLLNFVHAFMPPYNYIHTKHVVGSEYVRFLNF